MDGNSIYNKAEFLMSVPSKASSQTNQYRISEKKNKSNNSYGVQYKSVDCLHAQRTSDYCAAAG